MKLVASGRVSLGQNCSHGPEKSIVYTRARPTDRNAAVHHVNGRGIYRTQSYSAVSVRRNPESQRHQQREKNAGNDEGVHVEPDATSDRHRIDQLGELESFVVLDLERLDVPRRRAGHYHPLVAFAVIGQAVVCRAVEVQIQPAVVDRPRRHCHAASETRRAAVLGLYRNTHDRLDFYRATLSVSAVFAVGRCPSVSPSRSVMGRGVF